MKIGIIIYSQTGNTLSVAKKLSEKLAGKGHQVILERVETTEDKPSDPRNIKLKTTPDLSGYDALILGAPVMAFSLSIPFSMYLNQTGSMNGKKVACYVTKAMPFKWTGGNQAIGKLKSLCEQKGAKVLDTEIINWSKDNDASINSLVERFSAVF